MSDSEKQPDISSIPTEELRERVCIFLEAVDMLRTEIKRREATEAANKPDLDDGPSIPIFEVRKLPES